MKKCSDVLSKDEKLKEYYEKYIRNNIKEMKDTTFEKFFADINGNMDLYRVESFKYDVFVDVDGYIVNETVQVTAKLENVKPGNMTGLISRTGI